MLNASIRQHILGALQGSVLSTSMVAKKTQLSRITVTKYLNALEAKNVVQCVQVGKAIAWRVYEQKSVVAIIANTQTARMIKLSLGDRYTYLITTSCTLIRDAFIVITDNPVVAKDAFVPAILIGHEDDEMYCLPKLFDPHMLKMITKKIALERVMPPTEAKTAITIEHFDEFEDAVGIHKADELLKLVGRILRENRTHYKQFGRDTFLVTDELSENTLVDIENIFSIILCHVYGQKVVPGETFPGQSEHTIPQLSITLTNSSEDPLDTVQE